MTTKRLFIATIAGTLLFSSGLPAHADSSSVSITSQYPSGAIAPGNNVSFVAAASGFIDPTYSMSDASSASGGTTGSIDKGGYFSWTPNANDAGRHVITVTAKDSYNHTASAIAIITVVSTTISIGTLSPGPVVAAGQPLTFSVTAPGFVSPAFIVSDSYSMSSLWGGNINSSGEFSWTPTRDDFGAHAIVIRAYDAYGRSAQASVSVTVINPDIATTTAAVATTTVQSTAATTTVIPVPTTTVATPSAVSAATTTNAYRFTTALALGSRGIAVTELQKRLIALKYLNSTATGYFGAMTATAVKKFQAAQGLAQVGNVGPATRAALNK